MQCGHRARWPTWLCAVSSSTGMGMFIATFVIPAQVISSSFLTSRHL